MRNLTLAALTLLALLVTIPHRALTARAAPPAPPMQDAREVSQPAGWDADLALTRPADLNADPNILEFNLEARIAEIEILPGVKTPVWTYNGVLPGPYIRAKVGDTVIVHFRNSLPEETTIHWHGVRVPNNMDGAPGMTQAPIPPGGEFRYEFIVRDAGTFWYHPHLNSAAQVGWGLYGPFIVEDPGEPAAFGDDLVLVLSDMSIDEKGALLAKDNGGAFGDLFGREGNVLLVNGKVRPRVKVRAGKPQRWRFINAARARYYGFALRSHTFTRIGGDGGLAARPEPLGRWSIVPGERTDVVVTPSAAPGSTTTLRWLAVDRGYGTVFNRSPEAMLDIETVNEPPVVAAALPQRLREIPPIDVRTASAHTLDLTINREGNTVEMGINGVPSWKAAPLHARIGETHVWTIKNDSAFDHPFHLHGFFFQVIDDRRVPEWKDTVNVPVKSSVKLAIRFDERPGMWMFHCHILDHAEVGMMGHLHLQ